MQLPFNTMYANSNILHIHQRHVHGKARAKFMISYTYSVWPFSPSSKLATILSSSKLYHISTSKAASYSLSANKLWSLRHKLYSRFLVIIRIHKDVWSALQVRLEPSCILFNIGLTFLLAVLVCIQTRKASQQTDWIRQLNKKTCTVPFRAFSD